MVAIKCVAKKSLNKASVENLLTEIEILKGIRHPHIVQLKDFQVRAWLAHLQRRLEKRHSLQVASLSLTTVGQ